MLAFVFWHWPQTGVAAADYESRLRDFQTTLAANKPPGFLRSAVFRASGMNWLGEVTNAYEEWYVVDGSAALDPLNDAAVGPVCRAAHDAAAQLAAGGAAGLYRLREGEPELGTSRVAYWFAKPAGMKYEEFYELMKPLTSLPARALWGRQMVLGPAPEFCLHSAGPVELPFALHTRQVLLVRL